MNRYSKYSEKAALNNRVFNVKVLIIGTFNQKKALEGAFSVITNLRMDLFEALVVIMELVEVIIRTFVFIQTILDYN